MKYMHRQSGGIDRRTFLKMAVGSGFALAAFPTATQTPGTPAELKQHQQPSAFVSIADDGTVTVTIGKIDIGQGVHTALPMLVAEEMDADWNKVRCELAPAGEAYKDPVQQAQVVGGSTSVKNSWMQYREIGARMRAMLVSAAAKRFALPASQLKTEAGAVIAPDGRRATYGELAVAAFSEPVPASVELKLQQHFRLIGVPTGRLDARDKSSGRQKFGIDVLLPGMRTAVMLHPPVFGAKVAHFDAARAKAIAGVEDVYQVPLVSGGSGLAIVADGFWPTRTAREVLQVEWDTRGLERVDSDALLARYRELATQPGLKVQAADTSALASASHKIVAEYSFPYLAHTPMEPLNCTIDHRGDQCTVWVGSQFQTVDQAEVAPEFRTGG
jgi:isoquinoline 1-oxidoreductase beta subunit